MFNTIVRAGAVGAGAAPRYGSGSGSGQKMRLLAAPASAPQHWVKTLTLSSFTKRHFKVVLMLKNSVRPKIPQQSVPIHNIDNGHAGRIPNKG
jgi:hypothetical protein